MDPRRSAFCEQAGRSVPELLSRIMALQANPSDPEAAMALREGLGVLEREAGLLGLAGVARVALAAGNLSAVLLERHEAPGGGHESLLSEAIEAIRSLAVEAAGGPRSDVSPSRLASELEAAAEAAAAAPRPLPAADPEIAPLPEPSRVPRRKPLPPPSAASAAPAAQDPGSSREAATSSPASSLDTARFLGKFRDATEDHLQRLNADLLRLEKNPGDAETVKEVLREIHTLKGESRMMGFADISGLAHAAEDLLKALRDTSFARLPRASDHLFGTFDRILALTRAKVEGTPAGMDVDSMCASLRGAAREIAAGRDPEPAVAPSSPPEPAPQRAPAHSARPPADAAPQPPGEPAPRLAGPAPEASPAGVAARDETIRVAVEKLDSLAGVTGDILLQQSFMESRARRLRALLEHSKEQQRHLEALRESLPAEARGEGRPGVAGALSGVARAGKALAREIGILLKEERESMLRATLAVTELRGRVQEIRMLPVSTLFDFYPRIVRDLARQYGKEIDLEIAGAETELDRKILEELRDPLVHLVRNAIDHGIETPGERAAAGKPREGKIRLRAAHEGDKILIGVEDDGRGMDPTLLRAAAVRKGFVSAEEAASMTDLRAVDLIFLSGFSSKEQVTDLSGRGVGMDVVRENVERLKGSIQVESRPGAGTRILLRLPLTLALARMVLFRAGGMLLGLPSERVQELAKWDLARCGTVGSGLVAQTPEGVLPLVDLARLLGGSRGRPVTGPRKGLVLREDGLSVGIVVDALVGEREVIAKGLGPFLGRLPIVSGASILSGGEVALLLSPTELVRAASGLSVVAAPAHGEWEPGAVESEGEPPLPSRILLVDDSVVVRDLFQSLLREAGYLVVTAEDGEEAWERLQDEPFDLLVTDLQMPRLDGEGLLRRMRGDPRQEGIPAIVLSASEGPGERERIEGLGRTEHHPKKKIDTQRFLDRVAEMLPRRGLHSGSDAV